MSQLNGGARSTSQPKSELRHEFVAMMFAVAIGEVGIQASNLVRQAHYLHYLPAYSHLLLATIVIAASFVGWTKSPSPGGLSDVEKVLQWEFVVLLVDVFLVICYFILVRAFDKQTGESTDWGKYAPTALPDCWWIAIIFTIYLIWDPVTKFVVKPPSSGDGWKLAVRIVPTILCCTIYLIWDPVTKFVVKPPSSGDGWKLAVRIVPTILCCASAWLMYCFVSSCTPPYVLLVDLALLCLVLLFRALKDWPSAHAIGWSIVLILVGILLVIWSKNQWHLPNEFISAINSPPIPN